MAVENWPVGWFFCKPLEGRDPGGRAPQGLAPEGQTPQLQWAAPAAARGPWAGKVITNGRSAWAQRGRPKRPPQLLHWIFRPPLPRRLAPRGVSMQMGSNTKPYRQILASLSRHMPSVPSAGTVSDAPELPSEGGRVPRRA